jgi:hypothetical protein
MKLTRPPARDAATAWLEPLPPGPSLNDWPISVSPQAGMRLARKVEISHKAAHHCNPFLFHFWIILNA